jgi:hypothetical protein
MACLDDDAQRETPEVIWDVEVDKEILLVSTTLK